LAARFALNRFDAILLLARQTERLSDFRIGQGLRAALLQHDLFEALCLFRVKNLGDCFVVRLGALGHFRLPFFPAQIAQARHRAAL